MQHVADLTGSAFTTDATGVASVTFPTATSAPSGAVPRTLAPSPLARTALPLPPARGPAAPEIDLDDIYDRISARLRRELLHDRERIGDLVGDLQPIGAPR